MFTTRFSEADIAHLAEVLFASPLQVSDRRSPDQAYVAIDDRVRVRHDDHAECQPRVATEARDHSETSMARMLWALATVYRTFSSIPFAA